MQPITLPTYTQCGLATESHTPTHLQTLTHNYLTSGWTVKLGWGVEWTVAGWVNGFVLDSIRSYKSLRWQLVFRLVWSDYIMLKSAFIIIIFFFLSTIYGRNSVSCPSLLEPKSGLMGERNLILLQRSCDIRLWLYYGSWKRQGCFFHFQEKDIPRSKNSPEIPDSGIEGGRGREKHQVKSLVIILCDIDFRPEYNNLGFIWGERERVWVFCCITRFLELTNLLQTGRSEQ